LLQTYGEHENEFHNGKTTIKQYWEKIAKIMQEKSYNVTKNLNVRQNFKPLNDSINVF